MGKYKDKNIWRLLLKLMGNGSLNLIQILLIIDFFDIFFVILLSIFIRFYIFLLFF